MALGALLGLLAPRPAPAKPVGDFQFVVVAPGDQTDPSIDGQYVIYANRGAAGDWDVLLVDFLTGRTFDVAVGPGDQDSPDLAYTLGAYRGASGIHLFDWYRVVPVRTPPGDGVVSAPAVGTGAAAWEQGNPGSRDIAVYRTSDGAEWALAKIGDQRAPAVKGSLVAYVDDADGGAIWLHDARTKATTRFLSGPLRSVDLATGPEGIRAVVVARQVSSQDDDIEVYGPDGARLAALAVTGVQRNPHVAGDWIAFEDVSTAFSQVVVWNWRTGLIFVPRPSETDQRLNEVAMGGTELRVVFEDSFGPETGRDIGLYLLQTDPLGFDDLPSGWPLTPEPPPPPPPPPPAPGCDDPAATVLATLELGRSTGKPLAGAVRFDVPGGSRGSVLPVAVCVDAERVSAAWITLEDQAIATPCDFRPDVVHLAVPSEVRGAHGVVAGVVAGKPGAWLTARVLAAPPPGTSGGGTTAPTATEPSPEKPPSDPPAQDGPGGGGCGTEGGLASLVPALLLVLDRRRRANARARSGNTQGFRPRASGLRKCISAAVPEA